MVIVVVVVSRYSYPNNQDGFPIQDVWNAETTDLILRFYRSLGDYFCADAFIGENF